MKPFALGDQQPRLERVLVWLEVARHVLAAEGLDDTLGALRKLHASLMLNDMQARADCLDAIVADRGWKALMRDGS